jgi:single-strand selective monofunctional uracil DNA glycosylase
VTSGKQTSKIDRAITAARRLADAADPLQFGPPVTHVYNPLRYAWQAHRAYLRMLNPRGVRVVFLGMNPGPWGMAQTGVPFGQIAAVRDWMGIDAPIGQPTEPHPKRPVEGLACRRSEKSGERLWGLFAARFHTPASFFRDHFVANYCPLVFMEASGRNRTPDKLTAKERQLLDRVCDEHLRTLVEILAPQWLVGVGAYAEQCLRRVVGDQSESRIVRILHPSPASPAANRGWATAATKQLCEAGVWSGEKGDGTQ